VRSWDHLAVCVSLTNSGARRDGSYST
jgi:hypothetical protein